VAWKKESESKTLHKSSMTIYSYAELKHWMGTERRTEKAQQAMERYEKHGRKPLRLKGTCPICGAMPNERGYVRAPAMPNEWAFAKLFACPRCWPPPLGENAQRPIYEQNEQEQADAANIRLSAKGIRGGGY